MTVQVIALTAIFFLVVFGIVLVGIVLHEAVHVLQGNTTSKAVCWAYNMQVHDEVQQGKLMMFTVFDGEKFENVQSYRDFREWTEASAGLFERVFLVVMGFLLGLSILTIIEKRRKN